MKDRNIYPQMLFVVMEFSFNCFFNLNDLLQIKVEEYLNREI